MSDDLLPQFILEGRELAQAAAESLMTLEAGPDPAALDAALRAFHTLKGSAGLFDAAELGALMHIAEDRLVEARAAGASLPAETAARLLEAVGETERWLDAFETGGAADPGLRASTARLTRGFGGADPMDEAATPAADWASPLAAHLPPGSTGVALRYRPEAQAYFRGDDPLALIRSAPGLVFLAVERAAAGPADATYSPFLCDIVLTAVLEASLEAVRPVFRFVADQVELAPIETRAAPAAAAGGVRSLRVAPERLDELAALVDEAVIAKNALAHATLAAAGTADLRAVTERQARLDRALARLHDAVGGLRLAPLSQAFARLSRQARDLAAQLGKSAELTIEGAEVEVDKDVVEGLFEPLIHLLRNALDHGVEPPEERRAHGKPERARLRLSARADGDRVVIELADDGRGLDLARIRAVAVARGLISEEAAAGLDDAAAADLVFAPGFSTAREVSEISGRGVGLDAVRAAVMRLGGRVSLESRPGEGSLARIVAPLRAVMTKVAVVTAGGRRYGAPLQSVREIVRVRQAEVSRIRAGRAFVLRDEILPLVSLGELMGDAGRDVDPMTVVVVGRGSEACGVAVDALAERLEAPVRPASGLLSGLPGLQGTLVENDGRVLMVLDLEALIA